MTLRKRIFADCFSEMDSTSEVESISSAFYSSFVSSW